MRYPAYLSYKPSGVEWLGDVPEHWDVTRSDRMVSTEKHQLSPDAFTGKEVLHYSIPTVQELGTGAVENGDAIASAKQLISHPVVLVSRLNPRKATICRAEPHRQLLTLASTEFVALKPSSGDLRYLKYLVSSELFRQRLDSWVQSVTRSHQRARPEEIYRFWYAWPEPDEQRAIADFLDRETVKIDTLVDKKRALINRLKEKRTALISRTVTRGLPADAVRAVGLDPHPRLEPSGIDWLGDVPEHWEVQKFSREVRIAEGQVNPDVEPFVSMLLVAPNHIESGTGRLLARQTAADQGAMSGKYLCRKGEVVYSKIRPALAKTTLAPEDCLCSADMYPMRPVRHLNSRFLLSLLLSSQFTAWSVLEADRVAMPKINRETLNELRLPVPPPGEQEAIADFLDRETAKIDQMVAKVDTMIERLQEYRTALITAAVTGKIDVRGVVA